MIHDSGGTLDTIARATRVRGSINPRLAALDDKVYSVDSDIKEPNSGCAVAESGAVGVAELPAASSGLARRGDLAWATMARPTGR